MKYMALFSCIFFICMNGFGLENQTVATNVKGLRFPNISPNGEEVAFVYQSDIWIANTKGGEARQLTFHNADDTKPVWSPDGKWLAFSSNRSGNYDVWVISANGGEARQITWDSSWDTPCDWSLDGKEIIFCSYRGGEIHVWIIPTAGGWARQITTESGRDAALLPEGDGVVFAKGSVSLWQKGYQGSSNWDLYTQKFDEAIPKRLTDYQGNDIRPIATTKGHIYYLRENLVSANKNLVYNLCRLQIDNTKPNIITSLARDIYSADVSKDDTFAIVEMDFLLWMISLENPTPQAIPIQISQEKNIEELQKITVTSGCEMGHWSSDGSQIVFILDNNIYTMASSGGSPKQITNSEIKKEWPRFSPDGESIAYCAYKNGKSDIYIKNIISGEEQQLTFHESNDFYHSWSPDGRSIVFTSERSGNRDIWLIASSGGTPRQITYGKQSEDDAVFSPDGKWLAFDSGESGNQEIWIMPADGDYKNAKQITHHKALTQVATWSKDSNLIAYETNDGSANASIRVISRNGGESMLVEANASVPCWSPNGDFILFESSRDDAKNFHYKEAPQKIIQSKKIPIIVEKTLPKTELQEKVFNEAWEYINNNFYDKDFHNKDWSEIGKRYKNYAINAKTDEEMNLYINRMLGELEASHLGISGSEKSDIETGYLGWTLEEVPSKKGLRVSKVIKDGPADKAWVREGDFVFQIEDDIISPKINFAKILNNKVGQKIKIFASPKYSIEDGRYIELEPVNVSKILSLQYSELLTRRATLVRQSCQGQVLYLHLREMNEPTLRDFRQIMEKYSLTAKGMILDLRDNVGGFIHQDLLTILQDQPYLLLKTRNGEERYQPQYNWGKPIVVIINENSFSDAEVFTHAFKESKLGLVVGVPTSGGVIGTRDVKLSNNATFRIPTLGYYTTSGENLEGLGVKPDYTVVETSEDRLNNKDPQLELAINLILQQIKGNGK